MVTALFFNYQTLIVLTDKLDKLCRDSIYIYLQKKKKNKYMFHNTYIHSKQAPKSPQGSCMLIPEQIWICTHFGLAIFVPQSLTIHIYIYIQRYFPLKFFYVKFRIITIDEGIVQEKISSLSPFERPSKDPNNILCF